MTIEQHTKMKFNKNPMEIEALESPNEEIMREIMEDTWQFRMHQSPSYLFDQNISPSHEPIFKDRYDVLSVYYKIQQVINNVTCELKS